jgi:NAD(P)-dependent dehydrogenase (short-subunit alcohol dehydrogenase family)
MPTILITGANRGIGLALTRVYAEDGWRVLAACRKPDAADDLQALAKMHDAVEVEALDVTDARAIAGLAKKIGDRPIDVLFNNAGQMGPRGAQSFDSIDYDAWQEVLRVNLLAPVAMAQAFADNVAASERRVVAMMSSTMGSIAENTSGGYYIYGTSKAALNMAVRKLAADLRGKRVIVVAFHPGWVRTDMGGSGASLSPARSAAGLKRVIDRLGLDDSGHFRRYDGSEPPW